MSLCDSQKEHRQCKDTTCAAEKSCMGSGQLADQTTQQGKRMSQLAIETYL